MWARDARSLQAEAPTIALWYMYEDLVRIVAIAPIGWLFGDAWEFLQRCTLRQDHALLVAAAMEVQEPCRGNRDGRIMRDEVSGRISRLKQHTGATIQKGFGWEMDAGRLQQEKDLCHRTL